MKILKEPHTYTDFLDKQTKQGNMDMNVVTWIIRSM